MRLNPENSTAGRAAALRDFLLEVAGTESGIATKTVRSLKNAK